MDRKARQVKINYREASSSSSEDESGANSDNEPALNDEWASGKSSSESSEGEPDEEESEEEDGDHYGGDVGTHSNDDDEDEDGGGGSSSSRSTAASGHRSSSQVAGTSTQAATGAVASDAIERVLRWRNGAPGATGPLTTVYNVEEKSDPNERAKEMRQEELERQYLIKWDGWSHLHNTWESANSLNAIGARGMKKLENYVRKQEEIELWRSTADKEYVEIYDCEQEMNDELLDEYTQVERVIAHQLSTAITATVVTSSNTTITASQFPGHGGVDVDMPSGKEEYLVKWCGLPYSECTWEDEALIRQRFFKKIDEYVQRLNSQTVPGKSNPVLRKRPRFRKLDAIPDYLCPNTTADAEDPLELRDYQLEGVNWLLHAWSKANSCILADEMGLGKTIQTIGYLSSLFHLHELYGPFLVVVPLSTMSAWQQEFSTWAPQLNTIVYMGNVLSREQIRQHELCVESNAKRLKANVVLVTYEIVLKDKDFLGSYSWACLVVDEAHRLKNYESLLYQTLSHFSTNSRLLITGTPLQNSLKELWALLFFIMPKRFDSWPDFERAHQNRDHKGISSLHKKLEPYLLRRVKKDVEKSLPAKVEQILRVDMTVQQKDFYKYDQHA